MLRIKIENEDNGDGGGEDEVISLKDMLTQMCANSAIFLQTSVFELEEIDLDRVIDYVAVLYKNQKNSKKNNLNNKSGSNKTKYIETEATWY